MKKSGLCFGICFCIIIIIIVLTVLFLKGPIMTEAQALYCSYRVLKEEYNMSRKEWKDMEFIAEKNGDRAWRVINRQMYDPAGGMNGGGIVVYLSSDRKTIDPYVIPG